MALFRSPSRTALGLQPLANGVTRSVSIYPDRRIRLFATLSICAPDRQILGDANAGGRGGPPLHRVGRRGGSPWHRCPVKDESCPRFFGYEICGWALLPLGEGGPRAKRKGRMRGQFQLSKRAPHPPLRGTFSPWEKGQTTPSFLTFRFRATAFQNRLTGQRWSPCPPDFAEQPTFSTASKEKGQQLSPPIPSHPTRSHPTHHRTV